MPACPAGNLHQRGFREDPIFRAKHDDIDVPESHAALQYGCRHQKIIFLRPHPFHFLLAVRVARRNASELFVRKKFPQPPVQLFHQLDMRQKNQKAPILLELPSDQGKESGRFLFVDGLAPIPDPQTLWFGQRKAMIAGRQYRRCQSAALDVILHGP